MIRKMIILLKILAKSRSLSYDHINRGCVPKFIFGFQSTVNMARAKYCVKVSISFSHRNVMAIFLFLLFLFFHISSCQSGLNTFIISKEMGFSFAYIRA